MRFVCGHGERNIVVVQVIDEDVIARKAIHLFGCWSKGVECCAGREMKALDVRTTDEPDEVVDELIQLRRFIATLDFFTSHRHDSEINAIGMEPVTCHMHSIELTQRRIQASQ